MKKEKNGYMLIEQIWKKLKNLKNLFLNTLENNAEGIERDKRNVYSSST
jgi:hypothetical protein